MTEELIDPTTTEEPTTEAAPDKSQEKKYSDAEVNRMLARERKSLNTKFEALKAEHDTLLQDLQEREAAAEERAKTKVEELRKGVPDNVSKLLDKLTYQEQLEWLSDPANKVEKQNIPALPSPVQGQPRQRRKDGFVI